MPNWVANHLTIQGEGSVDVMRSLLKENKEAEDGFDFDFNKIKPMPESLNIEAGEGLDWCCENWGTKWNACRTNISEFILANAFFDTAWSDVRGLMQELSTQHPECTFEYEFAEEQAGYYAGFFNFQNGEVLSGYDCPEYSKESYEIFFNLWGLEDEYEFNVQTGTYGNIEKTCEEKK